jgi:Family of unknown function (DUF6062)
MSQESVGYVRLLEACAGAGCPVCRCVTQDSRRHLDGLLYEQVTDPETRRRIRRSAGFCNWHTWMLLEIQGSRSGAAIIYEDLLGRLVERVRRDAEAPARRGSWLTAYGRRAKRGRARLRETCPACEEAAGAERRYLETLLAGDGDAELQLAYARSQGLCGAHLLRAIELAAGRPGTAWLVARTIAKWARLRDDLARFVSKHDYRNQEPFTATEAEACERAFEILSGAPGVFGNDLHRRHPPADRS